MKKIIKGLLISLQVFCLFFVACSIDVSAEEKVANESSFVTSNDDSSVKKKEISDKMWDLQNSITKTLIQMGDHYAYDEEKIRSLVEDFDLNEYNEIFNVDYTIDSLTSAFIAKISSFEIKPNTYATTEAYSCELNKTYYEWNYQREYRDTDWTNNIIKTYTGVTDHALIKTLITVAIGIKHPIIGNGAGLLLAWASDYLAALKSVNNGCGTVVDYNTFSQLLLYYEADQQTFPGHF